MMLCKTPTQQMPQEDQLRLFSSKNCSSALGLLTRAPALPLIGSAFVDLPVDTPRPQGHRMYSVSTPTYVSSFLMGSKGPPTESNTACFHTVPSARDGSSCCHNDPITQCMGLSPPVLIFLHESFRGLSCLCFVPYVDTPFVFSPPVS